jgi:hypothetical protein
VATDKERFYTIACEAHCWLEDILNCEGIDEEDVDAVNEAVSALDKLALTKRLKRQPATLEWTAVKQNPTLRSLRRRVVA